MAKQDLDLDVDITRFEMKWGMLKTIVRKEAKVLLKRFIWGFGADMASSRMSGYWKSSARVGVGTRTGTLKREFASSLVSKGTSLSSLIASATMGSGLSGKYAAILEKGGTIRKKNKKLKVPLSSALTPAGVPKKAAMSKDLVVLVRKFNGETKVFLGVKVPGGTDIFYWILKDKVKIKKRLGYYDHFEKYKRRNAQKLIDRSVAAIADQFNKR